MSPSDSATNFITRRDFMKKSALTVGAISLLAQGVGLALDTSGWFCNALCVGAVANIPTIRYWSIDAYGKPFIFELGSCYCSNGHRLGTRFIVNSIFDDEAQRILDGVGGQAWGTDPLPPGHVAGGCGIHH